MGYEKVAGARQRGVGARRGKSPLPRSEISREASVTRTAAYHPLQIIHAHAVRESRPDRDPRSITPLIIALFANLTNLANLNKSHRTLPVQKRHNGQCFDVTTSTIHSVRPSYL